MNLNHTPGPWKISDHGNRILIIADDKKLICTCAQGFTYKGASPDMAEAIERANTANADLISCAPEMLEWMIKYAIEETNRQIDNPMYQGRASLNKKLVELIERAAGKSINEVLK